MNVIRAPPAATSVSLLSGTASSSSAVTTLPLSDFNASASSSAVPSTVLDAPATSSSVATPSCANSSSAGSTSTTTSAAFNGFSSSAAASTTTAAPSIFANIREWEDVITRTLAQIVLFFSDRDVANGDRPMEIASQFVHIFELMLRRHMENTYATMVERDQLYESLAKAVVVRDEALIERDQAQSDRNSLHIQHDQARERERDKCK